MDNSFCPTYRFMPLTDRDNPTLDVAVALPLRETFSYSIPDNLVPQAEIGRRVLVPFRNRKVIGYVLEKRPANQEKGLKEILDILEQSLYFLRGLSHFSNG